MGEINYDKNVNKNGFLRDLLLQLRPSRSEAQGLHLSAAARRTWGPGDKREEGGICFTSPCSAVNSSYLKSQYHVVNEKAAFLTVNHFL